MIFQQIMTELSGAKSEEDRLMGITKIALKLLKQNGCCSKWNFSYWGVHTVLLCHLHLFMILLITTD
jgi:hypothetical protein